jgi:predicted dinucleotide-binding enzyme
MTLSDTTVAIIGTGNIGHSLAANFAAGGQDFLLAGRDQETARKIASTLDGHAEAVSVDEAIERADALVLAVWFDIAKQLITEHGAELVGKVVIAPDGSWQLQLVVLSSPQIVTAPKRRPPTIASDRSQPDAKTKPRQAASTIEPIHR